MPEIVRRLRLRTIADAQSAALRHLDGAESVAFSVADIRPNVRPTLRDWLDKLTLDDPDDDLTEDLDEAIEAIGNMEDELADVRVERGMAVDALKEIVRLLKTHDKSGALEEAQTTLRRLA